VTVSRQRSRYAAAARVVLAPFRPFVEAFTAQRVWSAIQEAQGQG
jgi:hypothetical protein